MADIAQKIIAKANLTRVSSLPELLLCELELLHKGELSASKGDKTAVAMAEMLAVDPFLYAQILASNDVKNNGEYFSPQHLLEQMSHDSLKAKLRQATAQISFGRASNQRLRFLKQLYLQSVLSRSLAEQLALHVLPEAPDKALLIQQAAYCGLFLNIGALVLEQVFAGRYLEMLAQAETSTDLLENEISEFGIDHAELGAQLLKTWGIKGFCCDALQYHHLDINQILDATPLVKIAWLANQLGDEKAELEVTLWADSLFDVQEASLMEIREKARANVSASLKRLNIAFSTMSYLPLADSENDAILKQEINAFKQLRKKAEADNLFTLAKESLISARGADQLGQAIGSVTRLLFGPCESLLFVSAQDDAALVCLAGTLNQGDLNQFVVRCEAERSVIAHSFVNNTAQLNLPDDGLTVIDKQLLSLLGTDNLCCEPIRSPDDGAPCGVLVLGINLNQTETYKKQAYLRNDLGLELGKILTSNQAALGVENERIAHYERRIRETIHEANNPLGIIKNYLHLLGMKQSEDTKIHSEISFIKSEIDRVSTILEKLKDEPALPEPAPQSTQDKNKVALNINTIVTKLVNVFSGSYAASDKINISLNLDQQLPEIYSQENAIRQIITNLVKNAAEAITREAMENGGTILVKTAGNFYMNGERYIQLVIKDNGPGMTSNILNAFSGLGMAEADQSRNSRGNSTKGGGHIGSGLSVVQSLVKELGGQITCQTTRSETNSPENAIVSGTEITVLIPVNRFSPEGVLIKDPEAAH